MPLVGVFTSEHDRFTVADSLLTVVNCIFTVAESWNTGVHYRFTVAISRYTVAHNNNYMPLLKSCKIVLKQRNDLI